MSLTPVALVVPTVVLHDDAPSAQHEVSTGDEAIIDIDDLDIGLGLGQSRPDDQEADDGLAWGLHPFADVPDEPPGALDSVQMARVDIPRQGREIRLSGSDEMIAELDDLDHRPAVCTIDERAIRSGHRYAIDQARGEATVASMDDDAGHRRR